MKIEMLISNLSGQSLKEFRHIIENWFEYIRSNIDDVETKNELYTICEEIIVKIKDTQVTSVKPWMTNSWRGGNYVWKN